VNKQEIFGLNGPMSPVGGIRTWVGRQEQAKNPQVRPTPEMQRFPPHMRRHGDAGRIGAWSPSRNAGRRRRSAAVGRC
jgi:hypothetical protein